MSENNHPASTQINHKTILTYKSIQMQNPKFNFIVNFKYEKQI